MDELEISGKRYISTRRAAKEHKYHSDYIGQLIRAKKVEGQKVGRSWYVVADSLAEYLGKEGGAKISTQIQVPAPILREAVTEPVEEKKVAITKEEEPEIVEHEIEDKEEYHVPLKISQPEMISEVKKEIPTITARRSTLRYMADDGPLYPRMEQPKSKIKIRPIERPVETIVEETVYVEEEPAVIIERPRRAQNKMRNLVARGGVVMAAGVITLGVVAAVSTLIISTTTVQGETANVGYSLGNL